MLSTQDGWRTSCRYDNDSLHEVVCLRCSNKLLTMDVGAIEKADKHKLFTDAIEY